MSTALKILITGILIVFTVFFSVQVQKIALLIFKKLLNKIGERVVETETKTQRYIFTHYNSAIGKLYRWLNEQVVCLGLKKYDVTPLGFFTFWCVVALPVTLGINVFLKPNAIFVLIVYILVVMTFLIVTKMKTATLIEKREGLIMGSIDMIIPSIGNGVQNAISQYIEVLPTDLKPDFKAFMDRIVNKGIPFSESMIILADNIGDEIFMDFAQKAIFFEETGDPESAEIFLEIIETNRLRRDLRYKNRIIFENAKQEILISSMIVWVYVFAVAIREPFTYNFIFNTFLGQLMLIVDIVIEVVVIFFITLLRSKKL